MLAFLNVKSFDRIVLGFLFFFLGGIATTLLASQILTAFLKIVGWYYIISGFYSVNKGFYTNPLGTHYRFLVFIWIIICCEVIIRGYLIDYQYIWFTTQGMINYHIFEPSYILCYLMPLTLCIPWQVIKLDKFITYATWIAIFGFILFVFSYQRIANASLESLSGYEAEDVFFNRNFSIYELYTFAVLCFLYIPKRTWHINIIGLLVSLIIVMICARRGTSLILGCMFCFSLYYYRKGVKASHRGIVTILLILILIFLVYCIFHLSIFRFLLDRGLQDSRSHIDIALMNQMNDWQKIFGKGLNGRYYFPIASSAASEYLNGYRYGSETGFYNLVLKGGYMMAFTYILMLIIPAYRGLFKSRNMLCRVGGFYILLSLIELYPFGILQFNMKFFIIWIMMSLCMNHHVLNMNDLQIKQQLFPRI